MFLDLLTEEDDGILSAGQWSDRGCNRSESLSNTSVTVCECDHLTHFAILLSVAPLNLTDAVVLSLEVIGYVGVSVSVVAMGLTIFTFAALKYVHDSPGNTCSVPLLGYNDPPPLIEHVIYLKGVWIGEIEEP